MKRQAGMTLVELQIASVLMGFILVALGVALVTVLNAVRVLNDAHTVYWNALAAMKSLHVEIMRSNRYGWIDSLPYAVPDESVYGAASPTNENTAPLLSLSGSNQGTELYLRADIQDITTGVLLTDPRTYRDDAQLHFHLNGTDLVEDNTNRTIATHVSGLSFSKLAYNAVAVTVITQGDLEDPLQAGNPKHEALVSTIVNLRCAAGESCEGPRAEQPGMYANDRFW